MNIDKAKSIVIQAIQSGDLTYGDVKQFTDVLFSKLWLENSRLKAETEPFYAVEGLEQGEQSFESEEVASKIIDEQIEDEEERYRWGDDT